MVSMPSKLHNTPVADGTITSMAEVAAFPDTNVFLHYRPLAELDWHSITKDKAAQIEVAPVVIRD
jgi:hypothetical protein